MRRFGYLLIAAGLLAASYLALVLTLGDPITGWYANHEQSRLREELSAQQPAVTSARRFRRAASAAERLPGGARANGLTRVASPQRTEEGSPLGVIVIPRMGLNAVFVEGTESADLDKAPGHYPTTSLPGSRKVVAIAAHRTTYGAWFRHIDSLRESDPIYLEFRGRRYTYTVIGHRIVSPTDWSIIRYPGFPELVLTSCHPVYSASHRYAVFARLTVSKPLDG
jgi:sortase A